MSVSHSSDSVICLVGLFLNTEPSELNTMIQYAHNVCARTAWDAERLQGQKYGKKRKAKKVGRSFCEKSGFMRIEEACFDTEGKKKGKKERRGDVFPIFLNIQPIYD
jgi:hypothetical protein